MNRESLQKTEPMRKAICAFDVHTHDKDTFFTTSLFVLTYLCMLCALMDNFIFYVSFKSILIIPIETMEG